MTLVVLWVSPQNSQATDNQVKPKLKLVWIAHDASLSLARVSKKYTDETGIDVEVIMLPYGSDWYSRIAAEFSSGGDGFDLAVWDSQSLAEFAEANHIERLNPYMDKSKLLSFDDFDENSLKRYAEYPSGSGNMWALPINQDAVGLLYRKDLFENPIEKKNFLEKYGYPLSLPKTYAQLQDIAEFFTRPERGIYGWAQFAAGDYDFNSSAALNFIWSYGGELWNPKTNEVVGYLDSPASIDGLNQYITMFKYTPDTERNWSYLEVNEAFKHGKLAMATQWYVLFDDVLRGSNRLTIDQIGFTNLPGAIGRDNLYRHQVMLGGQGIGINRYSKNKAQAWHFLEWLMQEKQQLDYSKKAKTALNSVLENPNWLNSDIRNKKFSMVVENLNDYWHLPEYISLLEILQQEITAAIQGRKSPNVALSMAARRQEILLKKAGYKISKTTEIPEVPDRVVEPVGRKIN